MQNPDDLPKLKSSDPEFHKLELKLDQDALENKGLIQEIRTSIQDNTVVREVHVRMSEEFVAGYPLAELNKLMSAIGKLPKLKYLCLGQMTGNVETFGTMPIQSVTSLLQAGAEKVMWLYMRGLVLTHVYKGSEEEKEDKGDLDATIHDDSEHRSKRKNVKKKKDSKKSSKKKSSKKESKKEEKKAAAAAPMADDSKANYDKLDKNQAAAKRALDKMGDALVGCKGLKRISLYGHFDECMQGCQLDPLFEGLGSLEEVEVVLFALTRHENKIKVDPRAVGGFLDHATKLKEFSVLYTELTDDHIDEVASNIANKETLEELTLTGTGDVAPETVGALFRAPHLKKLIVKDLTLDTQCVVAMSIALAHYSNLTHVEVQCKLEATELIALQQMVMVNTGIETFHLHLSGLESESAPLDLATATMANPKSKLTAMNFEGEDKYMDTKELRSVDLDEWKEIVDGVFTITPSTDEESPESYVLSLTRV